MYLGIDVGGTKTLVAVLDEYGVICEKAKVPTPQDYGEFLKQLADTLATFTTKKFFAAGVGVPATEIDRDEGVGISYGNLSWTNTPIRADLERLLVCPVVLENDAKLACLSEAMLKKQYSKVLYVTVSTGIGYGLTVDCEIDPNIGDAGGRLMMLEYHGILVPWESFASGHAIVERFHKKAQDITDEVTWRRIAHDLAGGFIQLIAITEPDLIIVGGSVGHYFDRFGPFLKAELLKLETPLLKTPELTEAERPEEAVVYGCYDLARQRFGNHAKVS